MNRSKTKNPLEAVAERIIQQTRTPGGGSRTSGANMAGGTPSGFGGIGVSVNAGSAQSGGGGGANGTNYPVRHTTLPLETGGVISTQNVMFWGMDNWNESLWG